MGQVTPPIPRIFYFVVPNYVQGQLYHRSLNDEKVRRSSQLAGGWGVRGVDQIRYIYYAEYLRKAWRSVI